MIIVRISGGLGNQMFQYAAGLALSLRHGVPLKCDLSWFDGIQLHQGFELERVFSLNIVRPDEHDYRRVLGWRGQRRLRPWLQRRVLRSIRPGSFAIEPNFQFWPTFFSLPGVVYLDGYWQSEKYFLPVAKGVRKAFTFAAQLSEGNAELSGRIQQSDSVSLHVRRGDYVSNPKISAVHGVCPLEYYQAAIRVISDRIAAPHFFVFSDDINWVRQSLAIGHTVTYIDHNQGAESYNDMRLMSLCKHHIIANSSFSWWGAWLNPDPDKIVVAPMRWFANYPFDTRDLYCEGWKTV